MPRLLSRAVNEVYDQTIITSDDGLDTKDCIEDIRLSTTTIPLDGIVVTYDNREFSQSLGKTSHHFNDSIAFKFNDNTFETTLKDVVWQVSRYGELTPVAILEDIVIDGCTVSKASLHNIDFIANLNLNIGDRVLVSKRNMIIPHIEDNLDKVKNYTYLDLPTNCSSCNSVLTTEFSNEKIKSINCDNPDCSKIKLQSLVHFKKMELGWTIEVEVYHLKLYAICLICLMLH